MLPHLRGLLGFGPGRGLGDLVADVAALAVVLRALSHDSSVAEVFV